MAGMSALTVRANMKMVFDHQEANKAQTAYMARIAQMEQGATAHTSALNRNLLNSHKQLVKDVKKLNDAADAELVASKEKIAKKVAASSERALARSARLTKPVRKGMKATEYRKVAEEYKAATEKIRAVNKKVAMDARGLGGTVGIRKNATGIDATTFLKQERHVRERIIQLQKEEVKNLEENSIEREMAQIKLEEFLVAQKLVTGEEIKRLNIQKEGNAKVRAGEAATGKGMNLNNRILKERMALLHRINGAIDSSVRQLTSGFQNALMFSGIALMSFGFKLQGVVSDFMAFEKELINAQSIYQQSFDILFDLSDQIVLFGTKYGVTLQDASEGLYTLASAGLEAEDSMAVLTETLKLAMAVQGDHDTIAKLTTQVIFGFKKEVSETAMITDMFAHSINKSLIEYQDLASSVKFAMPFFVATNQELEQLLGALQILSNRALEAGIAGRGLRQTLAEFAQHAEDNSAAFRKLGIELLDSQGMFKDLTVIAREFHDAFPDINDNVDMMTTLLEDLNVRGATAFVHLVREAKDFERAVDDLQNATGAATEMADVQQKSLANQVQVIKNALMAPFLLSDEVGRTNETLNTFGNQLHEITTRFEDLFLTKTEDGTRVLTDFGKSLRDTVLVVLNDLTDMIEGLLRLFVSMNKETNGLSQVIHLFLVPLKLAIMVMNLFGEGVLQSVIMLKTMNAILPISQMQTVALTIATIRQVEADQMMIAKSFLKGKALEKQNVQIQANTLLQKELTLMQMGANAALFAGILLINKSSQAYQALGYVLLAVAGAFTAAAIAKTLLEGATFGTPGVIAAMAAGAGIFVGMGHLMKQAMKPPSMDIPDFSSNTTPPIADLGMRMYDTGGRGALGGRHFPVMVEPGETIVSKTQNMLSGGGITLNIQGDIVTNDADDFAERIAEALPEALRMQNDIGGI